MSKNEEGNERPQETVGNQSSQFEDIERIEAQNHPKSRGRTEAQREAQRKAWNISHMKQVWMKNLQGEYEKGVKGLQDEYEKRINYINEQQWKPGVTLIPYDLSNEAPTQAAKKEIPKLKMRVKEAPPPPVEQEEEYDSLDDEEEEEGSSVNQHYAPQKPVKKVNPVKITQQQMYQQPPQQQYQHQMPQPKAAPKRIFGMPAQMFNSHAFY